MLYALRRRQEPRRNDIHALVPIPGTVLREMLADTPLAKIDEIEFVHTVGSAGAEADAALFDKLGLRAMTDTTRATAAAE